MEKTIKVGFSFYMKEKEQYRLICDQVYTMRLGEKRTILFCGREYAIKYQDESPKKVVITDCEDKTTYIVFHEDMSCTRVCFSLDTWNDECLETYVQWWRR